jgi:hypothetical protein
MARGCHTERERRRRPIRWRPSRRPCIHHQRFASNGSRTNVAGVQIRARTDRHLRASVMSVVRSVVALWRQEEVRAIWAGDSRPDVEAAGAQMAADGSEVSRIQLSIGPAVVGYRAQFKLRWFATKLHALTVVVAVPAATLDVVTDVTQQSIDYAKQAKGNLRGLQTGVAALPVVVSSAVSPEARSAVETSPSKRFAAQTLPAIVDLSSGQMYRYDGRLLWGGIYSAWLRERLDVLPKPRRNDG